MSFTLRQNISAIPRHTSSRLLLQQRRCFFIATFWHSQHESRSISELTKPTIVEGRIQSSPIPIVLPIHPDKPSPTPPSSHPEKQKTERAADIKQVGAKKIVSHDLDPIARPMMNTRVAEEPRRGSTQPKTNGKTQKKEEEEQTPFVDLLDSVQTLSAAEFLLATQAVAASESPTSPPTPVHELRGKMRSEIETSTAGRRMFKPLNPALAALPEHKSMETVRGIVFDVDGTLCLPQTPMFAAMRSRAQIPKGEDILGHISSLPLQEATRKMDAIKAVESEYMLLQEPQEGLVELMSYLNQRGVKKGLLTRNFEDPVKHLIQKYLSSEEVGLFEPVVTRSFDPPKPKPDGMWFIAREWGLHLEPQPGSLVVKTSDSMESADVVADLEDRSPEATKEGIEGVAQAIKDEAASQGQNVDQKHLGRGLIMVGDSLDDMTAGHTAGAATVLLLNDVNRSLKDHGHTDLAIERLDELVELLENGFVGHKTR